MKRKYATAFNNGNTRQSWRDRITTSGILMDIESNEIVAEGLPMPIVQGFTMERFTYYFLLLGSRKIDAQLENMRQFSKLMDLLGT